MAEIRVSTDEATPWASMTTTLLLDDGSPGDGTTGESSSANDSSPDVCRFLYATAHLKVQEQLGTIHTITGISYKVTLLAEMAWP